MISVGARRTRGSTPSSPAVCSNFSGERGHALLASVLERTLAAMEANRVEELMPD